LAPFFLGDDFKSDKDFSECTVSEIDEGDESAADAEDESDETRPGCNEAKRELSHPLALLAADEAALPRHQKKKGSTPLVPRPRHVCKACFAGSIVDGQCTACGNEEGFAGSIVDGQCTACGNEGNEGGDDASWANEGDEADEADPTAYMLGMGRSPGTDVTPISILISPSNQNIMRTALLQGSTPPTIATLPQNNNNNALRMIESEESKALIYQMDL